MGRPLDYLGQTFAVFAIIDHLGGGVEAEAFVVFNRATQRRLAMRLPVADDSLWDGDPKLPPMNWSLEKINAENAFKAASSYTAPEWIRHARGQISDMIIGVTNLYGVLQNGHLQSLSQPIRVRANISMRNLLDWRPQPVSSGLYLSFSETLLAHICDAAVSPEIWRAAVPLANEPECRELFSHSSKQSLVSERNIDHLLSASVATERHAPPLLHNPLLALANMVEVGATDLSAARKALRDPGLREGVTVFDIEQFACVLNLLNTQRDSGRVLELLSAMADALLEQPWNPWDNASEFELHKDRPDCGEYALVLQEIAQGRGLDAASRGTTVIHENAFSDQYITIIRETSGWDLRVPHATAFDHYRAGLRISNDYGLSHLSPKAVEYERIALAHRNNDAIEVPALMSRNDAANTPVRMSRPGSLFSDHEIVNRGGHALDLKLGIGTTPRSLLILPPNG